MNISQHNIEEKDYHTINKDFSGAINREGSREIVEFHRDMDVRIWLNDQKRDFELHWHNALELIMPVENYYDVIVNEAKFRLQPGEILLVPPRELHETIAPATGKRFIYLLDTEFITNMKGFTNIVSLLMHPIYIRKDSHPKIYEDIVDMLNRMSDEYFSQNEYSELVIYSLFLNLLSKLGYHHLNETNLFPNVRLHKQKEYIQKFSSLLDFIDVHYMEDLDLDTIAASIGFSKYHFTRLFKQYTGYTFCDYVNCRRIKIAESLLSKLDYSITEVALLSGFPSISTFNRLFKQQNNCTPSEYRMRHAVNTH